MFCVQFVQFSYTGIVCYLCLMWAINSSPVKESDHATFVLIPSYRQKLKTLKPTKTMTRLKLFGDARNEPIRTWLKRHILTYRGTLTSWRPMSAGVRWARRQRLLRYMTSIKEAVKIDKSKLEDQFASTTRDLWGKASSRSRTRHGPLPTVIQHSLTSWTRFTADFKTEYFTRAAYIPSRHDSVSADYNPGNEGE